MSTEPRPCAVNKESPQSLESANHASDIAISASTSFQFRIVISLRRISLAIINRPNGSWRNEGKTLASLSKSIKARKRDKFKTRPLNVIDSIALAEGNAATLTKRKFRLPGTIELTFWVNFMSIRLRLQFRFALSHLTRQSEAFCWFLYAHLHAI